MNTWQAARQIKHKLLSRAWPDSPFGSVFASVYVTQGPAEDVAPSSIRYPAAIIRTLDSTTDKDTQSFHVQKFEIIILVAHQGDQFGEFAMIGGHRISQGQSRGRGILEVEEQVRQALQFLDQTSGVRLQLMSIGAGESVFTADAGYIVSRPMQFQARLTTDRVYPAPNSGKTLKTAVSGGSVTLSWTWHTRFDLHEARTAPYQDMAARGYLTLVRKSGGTPPASVTDGTVVTLASNAATTVVDTPASGTYSYALFAQYDEFGDGTGTAPMTGTSIRTSTSATASGIVV